MQKRSCGAADRAKKPYNEMYSLDMCEWLIPESVPAALQQARRITVRGCARPASRWMTTAVAPMPSSADDDGTWSMALVAEAARSVLRWEGKDARVDDATCQRRTRVCAACQHYRDPRDPVVYCIATAIEPAAKICSL